MQAEIEKINNELDGLKKLLQWEDEALFAWEEELAKGGHQNDVLKNLELHDFDKFKELELKRQMLQGDLLNYQQIVDNEMDLLLRTQATLQAQANLFNEARKNKSKLMKRWCEATKIIETRKAEIKKIEDSVTSIKTETEELVEAMEPIKRRAEAQQKENDHLATGIEKFKMLQKQSEDIATEKRKTMESLKEEISNMDKEMMTQNSRNNILKAKIKDLQSTIRSRREKAERIDTMCMKLKCRLDNLNIKVMTDDQKQKNAEEIYQLGLKVLKEEEKELDRLQTTTSGLLNEMNILKSEATIKKSELDLATKDLNRREEELVQMKVDLDNLKKNIQLREEDTMYLKQKLKELAEEDESADLQRKFAEDSAILQTSIQAQKKEHATLRLEIKHLRKELRELNRILNKGKQELQNLSSKAVDLKLKMDGGNKLLKTAEEDQNKAMLELNLLKMQEGLAKEEQRKMNDQVNNLERKRVVVESALQERTMELKSHKDKLMTKKKLLIEERGNLKKSVDHLQHRIRQVNTKYEIIMDTISKSEDGEVNSVAYFQIKIAQEKRELIENGDELQAKIEKTEKEILAMENTLRLLNCTNENYKSNLETIELHGPEMQEFQRVEAEYHQEHEQYLSNLRMTQDMTKAIEKTKAGIAKMQELGLEVEQQWKQKEKEIEMLTKSLAGKQDKLARATKVLKKLTSDVKSAKGATSFKNTVRDIDTRIKAEQNKSAMNQLAEFVNNYVEARPMVIMLLNEKGISLDNYAPVRPTKDTDSVKSGSSMASRSGSLYSLGSDRDVDQFKGSDISISPSVVNLDPTLLIPGERKRAFQGYSSKFSK
ncbi:coiled-coil domain containing 39 [Nesidiocoris tenuis]|uniref:Coiled-coil domain-containing protein 39 n=1 Tax=Nesidiocoris tenuis TaxID=355587 RepID=A0ABN7B2T1_9HEMI|nr:coiled-coil domain containing 39 [Nesidiocoris tenuis]